LILIGVVFLLEKVNAVSWDAWDSFVRLWPILLIAGGLDGLFQRDGFVVPAFWLSIGCVLLLSTLGYLVWSVWDVILHLWPLLLISIGLDIFIGRRSIWFGLIGVTIMLAILAGTMAYMGATLTTAQLVAGEEISQALNGAERAVVKLRPAVGYIEVDAISREQDTLLVEGRIKKARGETVQKDYSITGVTGSYFLRSEGVGVIFPTEKGRQLDWDLAFTTSIPLDLDAELAVGELTVDLRGYQLEGLSVSVVIGQATIRLPEKGRFDASIKGVIGETVIVVPDGMEVRLNTNALLGGVEVPSDYKRVGDAYQSPGYNSASQRIDIDVDQVIGKITVEAQ
jgi:hypothetical protein